MQVKVFYYYVLWFVFSAYHINAQAHLQSTTNAETPNEYYLQVKQFNEFIDRFNYKTDWKGNKIDSSFMLKYSRPLYLSYLLNQSDKRLANQNDSSYNVLCKLFIQEMTNPVEPQYISLFSGQVKAKATVNISYLEKQERIIVWFTPEVLDDRSGKWVISQVETTCFVTLVDSLKTHFLAPNSHETSFLNLNKLEHLSNPIYFLPTSMANDTKLQFVTEVNSGRLLINNIESVVYEIDFLNWVITVEEFNRSDYNSGWLISNVKRL
ncbi:MAG: hypothetical protein JEZ09_00770 [Salinivirgaceae bacterium]|nr:hypothetical protein [Salinivirgaceae bacterium]